MNKEPNIEEAIKMTNNFIKLMKSKEYKDDNGWSGYYNSELKELGQAIETLISEYERLEYENSNLKFKYNMQKDSNKLLTKAIMCDDCNCKVCDAHKENIKLKEENSKLTEIVNKDVKKWLKKVPNSISKDKIKENLNKKQLQKNLGCETSVDAIHLDGEIFALEELLEEGD